MHSTPPYSPVHSRFPPHQPGMHGVHTPIPPQSPTISPFHPRSTTGTGGPRVRPNRFICPRTGYLLYSNREADSTHTDRDTGLPHYASDDLVIQPSTPPLIIPPDSLIVHTGSIWSGDTRPSHTTRNLAPLYCYTWNLLQEETIRLTDIIHGRSM